MAFPTRTRVWVPILVTFFLWILLVVLLWSFVSKTWADLGAVLYLIILPFIYRILQNAVGENSR